MPTLSERARALRKYLILNTSGINSGQLHNGAVEWFAAVVYDYLLDKSKGIHIRVDHIRSRDDWRMSTGITFILQAPSPCGEVVMLQHRVSVCDILVCPEGMADAILHKWCDAYAHQAFVKQPIGGPVTASEAAMRERKWKRSSLDALI